MVSVSAEAPNWWRSTGHHAVLYSTHLFGDGSHPVKFHSMPLAVIEAEGERLEPLVLGDGECGGGVESTAQ